MRRETPGRRRVTRSIGGGLFLSFGEAAMSDARHQAVQNAAKLGRKVTYGEVVNTETCAILSAHPIRPPLGTRKHSLRKRFAKDAVVKILGCNSGVIGWVYSDDGGTYYWGWSLGDGRHAPPFHPPPIDPRLNYAEDSRWAVPRGRYRGGRGLTKHQVGSKQTTG